MEYFAKERHWVVRTRLSPSREGSKRANHTAGSRISPRPLITHNHCLATMPGVLSNPDQLKTLIRMLWLMPLCTYKKSAIAGGFFS